MNNVTTFDCFLYGALMGAGILAVGGLCWALAHRGRKRWSAKRTDRVVSEGIQIIRASAGDVAVVTHPSMLTQEMRDWIIKAVERQLPQGVSVVVLDGGMCMSHVVRADGGFNPVGVPSPSR
ncbi:MAG: hypothetical protein M3Y65_20610 [Pseudomonadota bacterium]|nr:hypothetical protein [Pseudomonadota bacterium]